jgi:hypothetical protein
VFGASWRIVRLLNIILSIHILFLWYNNTEGKLEKFVQFIKERFLKMTAGQKRRLAVVCTVIFSVLLTLSVVISMKSAGGKEKAPKPYESVIYAPIPAEELFLPDEPDYIPGALLERERRSNWTDENASEYWQDPLKYGEEQWREKIETSIDEFLERIP